MRASPSAIPPSHRPPLLTSVSPRRRYRARFALHAPLFTGRFDKSWLAPSFAALFSDDGATPSAATLRSVIDEVAPGIYAFDLLSESFCQLLLDELGNYEGSGLPVSRPNSMNNYGLVLNSIGMERTMDDLQRTCVHPATLAAAVTSVTLATARLYSCSSPPFPRGLTVSACTTRARNRSFVRPLVDLLFPLEGEHVDHHHSFVVQYKQGEDLGLDMHTDACDVTLNVCLGKEFTGAGLTFCGVRGDGSTSERKFSYRHEHIKGRAIMHLGNQRHGADDIVTGERCARAPPAYTPRSLNAPQPKRPAAYTPRSLHF